MSRPTIDFIAAYGQALAISEQRLSWDEYGIAQAISAAYRSTCTRARNGAVLVRGKRVVMQGYNGNIAGQPHCDHKNDSPCDVAVHAESNAIYFAAREGIAIDGGECYSTTSPCRRCSTALIQGGIIRVVYLKRYRDSSGIELLSDAGVDVGQLEVWRPVPSVVGYEVSNLGNVRSYHVRGSHGGALQDQSHHLRPKDVSGYRNVYLSGGSYRYVHDLVLEAFVGPRPEGYWAAHENDIKADNRLENLRWATPSDNHRDRTRIYRGGNPKGSSYARNQKRDPGSRRGDKLTTEQIMAIRSDTRTHGLIAKEYGISSSLVSMIKRRKVWAHV